MMIRWMAAAALAVVVAASGIAFASVPASAASAGTCPLVVAHKGLHYHAPADPAYPDVAQPEDSLAAADAAYREDGIYAIEDDVNFSSDGVPVIIHDGTVDSMTASQGNVSGYTAAQLTSMRLTTTEGSSTLSNQYIPSLAQMLERVKADGGRAIIEIKEQDGDSGYGTADDTMSLARAQAFDQVWNAENAWDYATVHSFSAGDLKLLQQVDPRFTGQTDLLLYSPVTPDPVPGDTMENVQYPALSAAAVQDIHNLGEKAGAWTPEAASNWAQLVGYGTDVITTDNAVSLVDWERSNCTGPAIAATGYGRGYASLCIDDYRSSAANGAVVDQYRCNGSAAQAWTLNASGELVNSNGACLNDAGYGGKGTGQILWDCVGSGNEQWTFTGGHYVSKANGLCLNDPGYSTANGTQLILWTCGTYGNESFTLP